MFAGGKPKSHRLRKQSMALVKLAGPTGFEPAIFGVTGQRVEPGYTTGPIRDVILVGGIGFEPMTYGV